MNKDDWTPDNELNDPNIEPAKAIFGIGSHKVLNDGTIRFDFVVNTDAGDILLKGFRLDPSEGRLMPPCFRVGGGYQPIVRLQGPIEEMVLEMAQEMVEAEPVEAEAVEVG